MTAFRELFLSSLSIMVLTLIHHAYGALIYEEPFRLHIAYVAVPVIILLWFTGRVYQKNSLNIPGKIAFWIFMIIALVIPTGLIGWFEGGYNHVLKNILYFSGASSNTLTRLFPPPKWEMPNDLFFELTGIFQFVLSVYSGYYFMKSWKQKPRQVS